jgi:hypothetical protein
MVYSGTAGAAVPWWRVGLAAHDAGTKHLRPRAAAALLLGWLLTVLMTGCGGNQPQQPGQNPGGPVVGGPGKGIAVCVGLNAVDPAHYAGWPGTLFGCENDARDIAAIATQTGFAAKKLLTAQATRDAVLGAIRAAAGQLAAGDIFMLSYSGHGDQVPDANAPLAGSC